MHFLEEAQVLVIGDVMLDRYWEGPVERISPEAPVPVVQIKKDTWILGGAANVAHNISSLMGQVSLIGFCGEDPAAQILKNKLQERGIQTHLISTEHPTIVKLRVLSQHQQLIRLDFEKSYASYDPNKILKKMSPLLSQTKAVILSDYNKGTLNHIQTLIEKIKAQGLPIIIDPKGVDFARYRGAFLITPNLAEFNAVMGPSESETELIQKAKTLLSTYGIENLLLTRGAQGMTLIEGNGLITHEAAKAKEVFDVTGAGDTVVAVSAMAIAQGYSLKHAMHLANTAAGVVVGKLGTATISPQELHLALQETKTLPKGVLSPEKLQAAVTQAKVEGDTLVFTNGCFDVLHWGHVQYLKEAKALGDRLIVAVNDDASVSKLKGPHRPIVPIQERMELLASLACVDWVVSFPEDTPRNLLHLLQPDILVKGGDYSESEIVGHEIVKAYGGKVLPLKLLPGRSSTQIIEKIKEEFKS